MPMPTATAMPSATPDIGPATLRIEVSPHGAAVFVNGAEMAQTPVTLALAAGTYDVRVSQTGFAPLEETLALEPDGEAIIAGMLRDVTPPQLVAVAPTAPVRVGQPAEIRIEAQDNSAVALLELWLEGERLGQAAAGTFTLRWTPQQPGEYVFLGRAADAAGNLTEQELSLTVPGRYSHPNNCPDSSSYCAVTHGTAHTDSDHDRGDHCGRAECAGRAEHRLPPHRDGHVGSGALCRGAERRSYLAARLLCGWASRLDQR